MNVIADTNLLVRAAIHDDPAQSQAAIRLLEAATLVCLPTQALCEFVWVVKRTYKRSPAEAAASLRTLIRSDSVRLDDDAVASGLAFLDAGADFADGVIAFEGARLGGTTFASFDKRAVTAAAGRGFATVTP